MTDTNKTSHDYDSLKQQFKEKAWPLTEEKRKRSEALQIAFSDQPKKLGAEVNDMYKRMNATWLEDNADLVKAYREAVKQKRGKKVEEIFKEIVEKVKTITPKVDEKSLKDLIMWKTKKKESKETATNIPSDVATQEKKAITYFEGQPKYLKIIENIQKLRASGKINYEDLWWGKYTVTMPCGSKKLKMYFPADTNLSDSNYDYTDFDGKEISKKETTRGKLWTKEWKKYVEQKEKEWQKMLSESEFKTLISSLLPDGSQEEQILAFMMATWFYGWMWLSDKTWDFQRAVECSRGSCSRNFNNFYGDSGCSFFHSSFVK